jgi:hypothetical protein
MIATAIAYRVFQNGKRRAAIKQRGVRSRQQDQKLR